MKDRIEKSKNLDRHTLKYKHKLKQQSKDSKRKSKVKNYNDSRAAMMRHVVEPSEVKEVQRSIKFNKYELNKPPTSLVRKIKSKKLIKKMSRADIERLEEKANISLVDDLLGSDIETEAGLSSNKEDFMSMLMNNDQLKMMLQKTPFISNFLSYIYQLYRAESVADYAVASYQFASIVAADKVSILIEKLKHTWDAFQLIRTESFTSALDLMSLFFNTIINSKALNSLRNFILAVFGFKMFNEDITSRVESFFGPCKEVPIMEFVPITLDCLSQLAKYADSLLLGIPLSSFLREDNPLEACISEGISLINRENMVYMGLPVPGCLCAREFVMSLDETVIFLESYKKKLVKYTPIYNRVDKHLNLFTASRNRVQSLLFGKERIAPFAVLLYGNPGVGKSKVLPDICETWSKVKDREFDMQQVYTKPKASEYYNGHNPLSQPFIHISEPGGTSASMISRKGDPEMDEICSLVDNLPHPLNMADVESKGKMFANPEMVILDCNNPDLHLDKLYSNPAAHRRRYLYVETVVKDPYTKEGSCGIDPDKSLRMGGDIMDRWLFTVYRMDPIDLVHSERRNIAKGVDIYHLRSLLTELFKDYLESQHNVAKNIKPQLEVGFPDILESNYREALENAYQWLMNFSVNFVLQIILFLLFASFSMGIELVMPFLNAERIKSFGTSLLLAYVYSLRRRCLQRLRVFTGRIQHLEPPGQAWCAAFCTAVVASIGMWKVYTWSVRNEISSQAALSKFKREDESNKDIHAIEKQSSTSRRFVPIPNKVSPQWNVREVIINSSKARNNPFDIMRTISRNVRKIRVEGEISLDTHILGIKSTYAVVNQHAFGRSPNDTWRLSFPVNGDFDKGDTWSYIVLTPEDFYPCGDDLYLINLIKLQFVDIVDYLTVAVHKSIELPAMISGGPTQATLKDYELNIPPQLNHDGVRLSKFLEYEWASHGPSVCGNPLIITQDGFTTVAGIHTAGDANSNTSFATVIHKDKVVRALGQIVEGSIMMPLTSEAGNFDFNLIDPSNKSPFRYESLNGLRYFGKFDEKTMMNRTSMVKKTPFYDEAASIYPFSIKDAKGQDLYGPPPLKPFTRDSKYYSPFNIALRSISRPGLPLNFRLLERIVHEVIGSSKPTCVAPIPMDSAINGINKTLTRRLNANTGGGFGFPGKKYDYLPVEDWDGTYREPTSDLKKHLCEVIERLSTEETVNFVFTAHLKDEVRLVSKNLIGKTRVFYSAPLDLIVISRMYLYPLYLAMMDDVSTFSSCVGIDMVRGGHSLALDLLHKSDKILEGDYKAYDQSIPNEIRIAAASVVYRYAQKYGYNEYSLRIVRNILSCSISPFIKMNSDLFSAPLTASGMVGTAEFNSICGLIMPMYAWYTLQEGKSFYDHVCPRTYGDDVLMAVSSESIPVFNNFSYKEFCSEHFNMTFTPAVKDAVMQKYLSIREVSFLKRTFVYSRELDRWMCPLMGESIVRMCSFYIPSKFAVEEEQFLSMIASSLWEVFIHFPCRADYSLFRNKWVQCLQNLMGYKATQILKALPTFETIYDSIQSAQPISGSTAADCDKQCATKSIKLKAHAEDELKCMEDFEDVNLMRKRRSRVSLFDKSRLTENIEKASRKKDLELTLQILKNADVRTESGTADMSDNLSIPVKENDNLVEMMGATEDMISDVEAKDFDYGQVSVSTLADFTDRPILIADGNIALATPFQLELKVWDLLTLNPAVRSKLRNFAYLRADLRVRISLTGTPFHYGKLIASYQPWAEKNINLVDYAALSAVDEPLINYLSQSRNSTIMDVRENQPVDIECPFICHKPMVRLFNSSALALSDVSSYEDIQDMGTLYLKTINDIQCVNPDGTPIRYYVYAWLENAQLGSLTGTQVAIRTESGKTKQTKEKKNEQRTGPIQKFCSGAMSVSKALTQVPMLSPYANSAYMAFGGMEGLAAHFGWSKPFVPTIPENVRNKAYSNGALTISSDSYDKITLDPYQQICVDGRSTRTEIDELHFNYLSSISTYLTTFQWASTDVPFSDVWNSYVFPNLCSFAEVGPTLADKLVQPTPMAMVAGVFDFWRGDIEFTFEFACSQYHRGKMLVYFEPNPKQDVLISANLDLNKQYVKVVDLQEVQRITFCVRWAKDKTWLLIPDGDISTFYDNQVDDFTVFTNERYFNGMIKLVPLNPLTSPDNSDISVNVYVKCPNLKVNRINDIHLTRRRHIITESGVSEEDRDSKGSQPTPCSTLNESTAQDSFVAMEHFGELPVSFRSVMKRMAQNEPYVTGTTPGSILVPGIYSLTYKANIIPGVTNYQGTLNCYGMFDYLRPAYLALRGSVRRSDILISQSEMIKTNPAFVKLGATTSFQATPSIVTGTLVSQAGAPTIQGGITVIPQNNAGVDLSLPFYSSNLYVYSFASDLIGPNPGNPDNMEPAWVKNYEVSWSIPPVVNQEYNVVRLSGFGEDFTLQRFQGVPHHYVSI